jgi:FKBP-type peptidyl-prolyl cis-trans isomerase FklB
MKIKSLILATITTSTIFLATGIHAEDTKPQVPEDKLSYAIGLNIGMSLKNQGFEANPDVINQGMKDAIAGKPGMNEQEAMGIIREYQTAARAKAEEKRKEASKANREKGAAFLAENAKKPGVKTTASGLQYKVLVEGNGEIPKENHTVTAHYRGTVIDGKQFDSSYDRGEPSQFGVTGVIKGWTEALLMMPVGSKWQLFIPADLAYGDQQRSEVITPGSTLIFDIELIATKGPEPIVSDIIKVPSAEEMKKGAKIETLKPEDVERLKAEQQKK